jgi:hypothetical protein
MAEECDIRTALSNSALIGDRWGTIADRSLQKNPL